MSGHSVRWVSASRKGDFRSLDSKSVLGVTILLKDSRCGHGPLVSRIPLGIFAALDAGWDACLAKTSSPYVKVHIHYVCM